jgi:tyrosine-protein kinase Etk/Wzc
LQQRRPTLDSAAHDSAAAGPAASFDDADEAYARQPAYGEPAAREGRDHVNLLDLLRIVAENLRLLVIVPLLAGCVALGVSFLLTPMFTATTTFLPPQQQQSAAAMLLQSLGPLAAVGASLGAVNSADRYIAFIESRSVKDALIDRFDLINRVQGKNREAARAALAAATKVQLSKKGLMTVEVTDPDPKIAAELANAYVDELTRFMGRLNVGEAHGRRAFFEQELKRAKDGLTAAETALRATGISESAIKANPNAAVGGVAALMAQAAAKEVELNAMRGYLTEEAPQYKRAQNELRALRAQLAQYQRDDTGAPAGGDYVAKFRNFKYYETLFELVAKQYEAARIDESRDGTVIQVVDRALPPDQKSSPKKAQNAILATLATALALLVFIFVRHALSGITADPESARKLAGVRDATRRALRGR